VLAASLLVLTLAGQAAPVAQPAPKRASSALSGFSAERLARIDKWLQQYVDENRLAGAVALVLRDGKPVYERAVGLERQGSRPTHGH
jgi:CubicO group peptidase (beta-lactamase class C family)